MTEEPVKVYNFEVEDFHTYHVSGFGVLVHNANDYANPRTQNTSDLDIQKIKETKYDGTIRTGGRSGCSRPLEEAFATGKVKVFYIISNFQNPTGLTTSLEKRKAIYELAKKYSVMILEDNPYGDLRIKGEAIPSIKSMDKDGLVMYSRTFSKILAPGIRVGYISAPKEIIGKIVVCKQVADVHTNIWAQMLAYNFVKENDIEAHLASLRVIYKHKLELMIEQIEKNFSSQIKFTRPEGGLFIWCTLPEGSDMTGFCKKAVAEYKVAVVPGNAFMVSESDKTASFRLNFSTPTDKQIIDGCEKLGKLSKEMFGD